MKIEGFFLASRAGRRIFWTLLAAAAGPILLFGAITFDALQENFAAQAQRQRVQVTKYAGLALLDNLLVARTVLGIFARTGVADKESRIGTRRGRVLVEVASVDTDGQLVAGSLPLWQRWRGTTALDPVETAPGTSARLILGHHLAVDGELPVLMVLRLLDQPGRIWMAEVDHAYLFGELGPDATGERICVLDSHGHALFCPSSTNLDPQRRVGEDGRPGWRASWNLFLRPDFASEDWTLVNLGETQLAAMPGGLPLARMVLLGTLATLLIVIVLSLVQVRRTMVPLERLISGTRRLARHDFTVRVPASSADEFGELAGSFNEMAAHIGSQVEAMQVQSSIDREILNGLDVARILQHVVCRLRQLLPRAEIAIVELGRPPGAAAYVHDGRSAPRAAAVAATVITDALADASDDLVCFEPTPTWLTPLLVRPAARIHVQCARAGHELLALLVIDVEVGAIEQPAVLREIDELRDRVSVALASADRERRLVERATHDSLTGLANRAGLLEHLDRVLAAGAKWPLSLLFIDLDRFKDVNDAMGHQAGDELLRIAAQRLLGSAPPGTLVSRPSGDEFLVVVPGERVAADALAQLILSRLAEPIALEDRTVTVGASVGLARFPDHGCSATDLMRRADMAMYIAKARGGSQASWFDESLDERMSERTALRADLHGALARGEFELRYQPRVDASSGRVRCAEALLRWRHRDKGLVSPDKFIDLLEESRLIEDVGMWAIESACTQLAQWRAQGLEIDSVAVNVSSRQLHAADFAVQVGAVIARCGLAPSSLELEITESIFMGESTAAIEVLRTLRQAGVQLALDDFGTGYSSLSYLHTLPISILKVDRSFVAELGVRDKALTLTRSIIALARALQLHVVAEGVETRQQAELLSGLGCDELQGYLFARPLMPGEFARFLVSPAVEHQGSEAVAP